MEKTNSEKEKVEIFLDKELYPKDVLHTTAYVFLEKAYIFLKKGKDNEIIVELEPKNNKDAKQLSKEFKNQLINYAHHMQMNEKNKEVKKKLLQEIFAYNFIDNEEESFEFDFEQEDDIEDPEGILVPWEEKYNKNGENS
ncbi:MAG: His-Xaa-Ser system protein HxsD [Nanobdellota archaeon]